MAEGDINQNSQQSQPVNQPLAGQNTGNSFVKKKRRRRPRKKRPQVGGVPGVSDQAGSQAPTYSLDVQAGQNTDLVKKKKRRRRPKNKRPELNPVQQAVGPVETSPVESAFEETFQQASEKETVTQPQSEPEPELVAEPKPESAPEPEPEIKIEPAFPVEPVVGPEPVAEPEPVVEEPVVVAPVVVEPEPEPEPEPVEEPAEPEQKAPESQSGWAQLKEAIKKDHEETQKMMEQGPTNNIQEAEVIPSAEAAGKAGEALFDDELEKKEVIQIITKYAIGGCAIILVISALFFFRLPQIAFEGISGLFRGSDKEQTQQVEPEEDYDTEKTDANKEIESALIAGENKGTSRDKFVEGIETALVTGEGSQQYEDAPDAIKALYITGIEVSSSPYADRISSYMAVLTTLQNAFATDIHQMLDKSQDREKTLDLHLSELKSAYQEAVDTQRLINEEKDRLKIQFNDVTTQKDKLEKDFFVSLDKLEGNKSNDLLNLFIESSKRQVELKAHYNALNKASGLFDTALKNMDARIKDIELNRLALIQGVKVVDIKGSDLELIIQESDLQ